MNIAEHAPAERSPSRLDVVIGAGQAGLAMGYFLARQGRRFVILDGADSIGAAWRDRWDSLVLFTPRRYDGRVLRKTVDSRIARMRDRDVLVGSSPRELTRRFGVGLKPRLVGVSGPTAEFADGSELEVDAVVWATGFRPDYSWIELPVTDPEGRLRHRRGVTDPPGLYFLGLTWQHTRGSALLGWVKDDAEFVAERINAFEEAPTAADEARQNDDVGAPQQARLAQKA